MQQIFFAAIMAAASPALAQSPEPACPHCEEARMDCCKKNKDGEMHCKMMDQDEMEHDDMEHSAAGGGSMSHQDRSQPAPSTSD